MKRKVQAQRKFAQGAPIPPNNVTNSERRLDVPSNREEQRNIVHNNTAVKTLLDLISFNQIHEHKVPVVLLERLKTYSAFPCIVSQGNEQSEDPIEPTHNNNANRNSMRLRSHSRSSRNNEENSSAEFIEPQDPNLLSVSLQNTESEECLANVRKEKEDDINAIDGSSCKLSEVQATIPLPPPTPTPSFSGMSDVSVDEDKPLAQYVARKKQLSTLKAPRHQASICKKKPLRKGRKRTNEVFKKIDQSSGVKRLLVSSNRRCRASSDTPDPESHTESEEDTAETKLKPKIAEPKNNLKFRASDSGLHPQQIVSHALQLKRKKRSDINVSNPCPLMSLKKRRVTQDSAVSATENTAYVVIEKTPALDAQYIQKVQTEVTCPVKKNQPLTDTVKVPNDEVSLTSPKNLIPKSVSTAQRIIPCPIGRYSTFTDIIGAPEDDLNGRCKTCSYCIKMNKIIQIRMMVDTSCKYRETKEIISDYSCAEEKHSIGTANSWKDEFFLDLDVLKKSRLHMLRITYSTHRKIKTSKPALFCCLVSKLMQDTPAVETQHARAILVYLQKHFKLFSSPNKSTSFETSNEKISNRKSEMHIIKKNVTNQENDDCILYSENKDKILASHLIWTTNYNEINKSPKFTLSNDMDKSKNPNILTVQSEKVAISSDDSDDSSWSSYPDRTGLPFCAKRKYQTNVIVFQESENHHGSTQISHDKLLLPSKNCNSTWSSYSVFVDPCSSPELATNDNQHLKVYQGNHGQRETSPHTSNHRIAMSITSNKIGCLPNLNSTHLMVNNTHIDSQTLTSLTLDHSDTLKVSGNGNELMVSESPPLGSQENRHRDNSVVENSVRCPKVLENKNESKVTDNVLNCTLQSELRSNESRFKIETSMTDHNGEKYQSYSGYTKHFINHQISENASSISSLLNPTSKISTIQDNRATNLGDVEVTSTTRDTKIAVTNATTTKGNIHVYQPVNNCNHNQQITHLTSDVNISQHPHTLLQSMHTDQQTTKPTNGVNVSQHQQSLVQFIQAGQQLQQPSNDVNISQHHKPILQSMDTGQQMLQVTNDINAQQGQSSVLPTVQYQTNVQGSQQLLQPANVVNVSQIQQSFLQPMHTSQQILQSSNVLYVPQQQHSVLQPMHTNQQILQSTNLVYVPQHQQSFLQPVHTGSQTKGIYIITTQNQLIPSDDAHASTKMVYSSGSNMSDKSNTSAQPSASGSQSPTSVAQPPTSALQLSTSASQPSTSELQSSTSTSQQSMTTSQPTATATRSSTSATQPCSLASQPTPTVSNRRRIKLRRPPYPQPTTKLFLNAPVFNPTAEEFKDPVAFFDSIMPIASKYGICKVVPPKDFKPKCTLNDEMVFNVTNQYVTRLFSRWGPGSREMSTIKAYLASQSVYFKRPPLYEGMEVNLPKLYQIVQRHGGLKKVIECKRWGRVAEEIRFTKGPNPEKKLDQLYVKYLLPYDTLSSTERAQIMSRVERAWCNKYRKMTRRAFDPFHRQNKLLGESESSDEEEDGDISDDDEFITGALAEAEECVMQGRKMNLSTFKRISSNAIETFFPNSPTPTVSDVEDEYWRLVLLGSEHLCVFSASIDTGTAGYGFTKNKHEEYGNHPWNLKNLASNPANILRHLGSILGVTAPTLHLGMIFSTSCWHRDPHGLPWMEYMHSGPPKIWYGIPDDQSNRFRSAVESLCPSSCQNKTIWLPSDIAMIPPKLLREQKVTLSRVEQHPGEYIIVFPKAYSSSISTGLTVSESVYFASRPWLEEGLQFFMEAQISSEPTMISIESLLMSIVTDLTTPLAVLQPALSVLQSLLQAELRHRLAIEEDLPAWTISKAIKYTRHPSGVWNVREQDECEICRKSLFLSRVRGLTDNTTVCLEHAATMIRKRPITSIVAPPFELNYYFTTEEIEGILKNSNTRVPKKE